MKKLILIISVIFLFSNFNHLMAWDSTAARYLPLQVGNVWMYRSYNYNVLRHCDAYEKYSITGTYTVNNKMYYTIQRYIWEYPSNSTNCGSFFIGTRLYSDGYLRIDSGTMNIYSTLGCLLDSLSAKSGDSEYVCPGYTIRNPNHCGTSNNYQIFGLIKPCKYFSTGSFESGETMTYVRDFGLADYHEYWPGPDSWNMHLVGCIINGTLYGDTNIIGIKKISSEIPISFSISQNYPNPFNPSTNIKFSVPQKSFVKITIYNSIGQEITKLIDEELSPGTYESNWDTSNYPSGIYYYKLETSDFSESKKMILIK